MEILVFTEFLNIYSDAHLSMESFKSDSQAVSQDSSPYNPSSVAEYIPTIIDTLSHVILDI